MKKTLIGILIAAAVLVAVYYVLPQGAKDYLKYTVMKWTDKTAYEEIQVVRDAKVLNQTGDDETVTYGQLLEENIDYEYWTYSDDVASDGQPIDTICAYGSGLTLTYGESGDSGACDDSKLMLKFIVDAKGGYDLSVYVDGAQLSKADRDSILAKMCDLAE